MVPSEPVQLSLPISSSSSSSEQVSSLSSLSHISPLELTTLHSYLSTASNPIQLTEQLNIEVNSPKESTKKTTNTNGKRSAYVISDLSSNINDKNNNSSVGLNKKSNKKIKLDKDTKSENDSEKSINTAINGHEDNNNKSNKILANSKKPTDSDMAYNIFVRKIVDDSLDRTVTFCEQPKEIINNLEEICGIAFGDLDKSRHRIKIRSYLKACRRNSKKHNGKVAMKETPSHMCSEKAFQLASEALDKVFQQLDLLKTAKANRIQISSETNSNENSSSNPLEESHSSVPEIDQSKLSLPNTTITTQQVQCPTSSFNNGISTQSINLISNQPSLSLNNTLPSTIPNVIDLFNPFLQPLTNDTTPLTSLYLPQSPAHPHFITPSYPCILPPPTSLLPVPPTSTIISDTTSSDNITRHSLAPPTCASPPPAHTNSLMFPHNSIFSPFFSLSPPSGSSMTSPMTNPNVILQKILNCHSIDPDFGIEILRNKLASQEAINSLRLLAKYLLNKSVMVESYMVKDVQSSNLLSTLM